MAHDNDIEPNRASVKGARSGIETTGIIVDWINDWGQGYYDTGTISIQTFGRFDIVESSLRRRGRSHHHHRISNRDIIPSHGNLLVGVDIGIWSISYHGDTLSRITEYYFPYGRIGRDTNDCVTGTVPYIAQFRFAVSFIQKYGAAITYYGTWIT